MRAVLLFVSGVAGLVMLAVAAYGYAEGKYLIMGIGIFGAIAFFGLIFRKYYVAIVCFSCLVLCSLMTLIIYN